MPIRLMSHNALWRQEYLQSRSMILAAAEGWVTDVQHIGGTALQDTVAQPVIDMMAAMEDMQGLNEAASLIEGLNYIRVETPAWCQDELAAMLQKPRSGEPTHTLLVVRKSAVAWQRCAGIRDLLLNGVVERQEFESLKLDHFKPGCSAEKLYQIAKSEFFSRLATRF